MRNVVKYIIVIVLIIITIIGVKLFEKRNDEYTVLMYEFYSIYFDLADDMDILNSKATVALETLRLPESQSKIEEMEILLSSMKNVLDGMNRLPQNKEYNYDKLSKWHYHLILLSDEKYIDWWGISHDERGDALRVYEPMMQRLREWQKED